MSSQSQIDYTPDLEVQLPRSSKLSPPSKVLQNEFIITLKVLVITVYFDTRKSNPRFNYSAGYGKKPKQGFFNSFQFSYSLQVLLNPFKRLTITIFISEQTTLVKKHDKITICCKRLTRFDT